MGPVPLVGHEREQELIESALTRCAEGAGGVLLVSGEAGVGRTRLSADALEGWTGSRHQSAARPGADPFALFDGVLAQPADVTPAQVVRTVVATARDGPCVLLLDDLHWADSARTTAGFTRRARQHPRLCSGCRDGHFEGRSTR